MQNADALIDEIVAASEIPSEKRRREVARELRSHVDDFVVSARDAGHPDDQIEKMLLASLGDPGQIGRAFARVYWRERAVLHFSVFGFSTLAVATVVAAGVLAVQAGVGIGFGIPFLHVVGSRHTLIEAMDILATAAVYIGLISLERLFRSHRLLKAISLVSIIIATSLACASAFGVRAPYLAFGFINAFFLRTVHGTLKGFAARFGAVLLCFGLFGVWLWARSPGFQSSIAATLASWMVMGLGYQLMTSLAARIDRGLLHRLQRL